MPIETIYKYLFKWLRFGYPKECCLKNVLDAIEHEPHDFLSTHRHLNETLCELSRDYEPLKKRLLPSLMDVGEYFIDPVLDMDIHYELKSKYPEAPAACFFTSHGRYIDFETHKKHDLPLSPNVHLP